MDPDAASSQPRMWPVRRYRKVLTSRREEYYQRGKNMDYVNPGEIMAESLQLAKKKAALPIRDLLLRGILAGAFLGFATSLAIGVVAQGSPPIVGALLFPVGFVMLVLLGLELATGNFALLPPALIAGQVPLSKLLRNWAWVYGGNLI